MTPLGRDLLVVIFWIGFGTTLYTYFLYPVLLMFLSALAKLRRTIPGVEGSAADHLPTVTMLISAYNESRVLDRKIANCQAIDYPSDKISFIIGSDGSDDGTSRKLRAITDTRFRTVHSRLRRGKVQMLNRLIKMVSSDIVVFSDANTMYQHDAVRELVKLFGDSRVGGVIGKLELVASTNDTDACRTEGLYWRYENRIKQMESHLGSVPAVNGGIFAIRRELYCELPPQAVTEDQVLGMSLMVRGYRCLFAHRARACETVSSWRGELRRRIRISAGNFQSLLLVPGILNPACGWVTFAFISHKLLRWLVPFFLLAMFTSNLFLAGQLFYGSALLLQGLFYAVGLIATAIPKLSGILKVLSIPKYFLAMNAAIMIGLCRFLARRQQVTWAKAPRH